MSFNETAHPRSTDGTFAEKRGGAPEVGLAVDAPSPANGFLIPGRECECDVDFRCPNHDTDAEEAYYRGIVDRDPLPKAAEHGFDDRWDV